MPLPCFIVQCELRLRPASQGCGGICVKKRVEKMAEKAMNEL
jgi:hypothetical protein